MKVLITGASRGIGFALSQKFSEQGYEVVGIARNFSENSLFWKNHKTLSLDLGERENLHLLTEFCEKNGPYDVCIHNLGVNFTEKFEGQQDLVIGKTTYINMILPIVLTQEFLKKKLLKERGSFVFMNSLSHFTSYPGSAIYGATKDGLHSFASSLKLELEGQLHVMSVYPGPVETDQARENSPLSQNSKRMPASVLAHKIFKGFQSRQSWVYPGPVAYALALLSRLWPGLAERLIYAAIFKKL